MKRIRIGNDINISLRVLTAGEWRPLEGRNLRLVLRDPKGGEMEVDFSIVGDTVSFVYPGRKQRHIGRYSVELWENEGEPRQAVADVNGAFELVRWSDEQGGDDAAELQTETLELEVELDDALACLAALFTGDEVSDSRDDDKLVISRGNTAYTTTVAALQAAMKARLVAAETGIKTTQNTLSALPIKHLGVFDNMQQGYDAAATDGVCDDDKLALIFFTTAESIRNNCLIIQSVNRYHHITTQTMLMEGTSAKSWTRRIVLGGNKSVGDWQQLGGMVNTFHLSGTKLCGSLPSGTEVQLVDLAPIIPQVPEWDFRMLSNTADDELTALKSVKIVGKLGRFPIYEEVCMFRFFQPTFMRTYPTICGSRISGRTVLERTARYRLIEYKGIKELPTAVEGSKLYPSNSDIPELVIVTPAEKFNGVTLDKEHDVILDPTQGGETMQRSLIWVTTRYVDVAEIIKEN